MVAIPCFAMEFRRLISVGRLHGKHKQVVELTAKPIPGTQGKCVTCQCHLEGPWILDFGIAYGYRGTDSESAGPFLTTLSTETLGGFDHFEESQISPLCLDLPEMSIGVHRVCPMSLPEAKAGVRAEPPQSPLASTLSAWWPGTSREFFTTFHGTIL